MELDPRNWGRVAQGALILLILLRVPSLMPVESTAGLVGGVIGLLLGGILVVGLVRALFVSTQGSNDDDDSATT